MPLKLQLKRAEACINTLFNACLYTKHFLSPSNAMPEGENQLKT